MLKNALAVVLACLPVDCATGVLKRQILPIRATFSQNRCSEIRCSEITQDTDVSHIGH